MIKNLLITSKYKQLVLLILVLLVALSLRIFSLDKYPAGFNADEAAIGYNAYSIIKTGRDEYGEFLPLAFKSFGDFKPGLYFYFVIPSVALFGLNEFAVRFPSALFGTGLVLIIYLLAGEFFKDRKISFFSALFLAINPWAINFSRGGWETNSATFFIALGVLFFIKGLEKINYLFFSLASFLVSMYLYQSPRMIVPLLLLFSFLLFRKELISRIKRKFKNTLIAFFILFILSLPLVLQFISGKGNARFDGLSFLSDPGPANRVNELRGEHEDPGNLLPRILHNKVSAYLPNFIGHYLDHYSSDFLFINGDPLIRNKIPETGQFYLIEALFLMVGLIFLIKYEGKFKYLLLIWFLTAPLASAMTYQTPHAVRALSLVVPVTLIMAFGFVCLLRQLSHRKLKIFSGLLLLCILSFEFAHYLESYYAHYPKRYPLSWEYGFPEMVDKLQKYRNDFSEIVITDRYDQPYILVLFYEKYDPVKYQPQAVLSERDKFNYGTVRKFDKYEFHKITRDEILKRKNILFVAAPEETDATMNVIDAVYFPNGEKAFIFVKS